MGYIPEQWLHTRGTPRTFFLVGLAAVLAAVSFGAAYANLASLYFISLCMGLSFGAHWSLLPAITSDVFGLLHFAANYTTLQVGGMGSPALTWFLWEKGAVPATFGPGPKLTCAACFLRIVHVGICCHACRRQPMLCSTSLFFVTP